MQYATLCEDDALIEKSLTPPRSGTPQLALDSPAKLESFALAQSAHAASPEQEKSESSVENKED